MPPKRTTTPMTDAAIKQLIGADALVEHEVNRNSRKGDDSHDSGSGKRRKWFEKMESIFYISNCTVAYQIKFATYTLLGSALTWWNSHVKTVGHDAAYRMPWKTLKKMMTAKYCPRNKINKLEIQIWNMKESDEVEKYVGGLPDMIQGKILTFADRHTENKRKLDDNSRNNQTRQQPHKRQNVARAYTVGPGEKKEYGGSLSLCTKCNCHHNG
ncbi:reverse transcriptase domain-containing protein [Tanacetum coccineum]